MCCSTLCCVVLCYATQHCATLCCAECCVIRAECCATLLYAVLCCMCFAMLRNFVLRCAMLSLFHIVYFQDRFNPVVPYGVIGGVALLAGIVCLTLKETGHTPTRETLDDESHLKLTTLQTEGEFSDQTNRPTEKEISV